MATCPFTFTKLDKNSTVFHYRKRRFFGKKSRHACDPSAYLPAIRNAITNKDVILANVKTNKIIFNSNWKLEMLKNDWMDANNTVFGWTLIIRCPYYHNEYHCNYIICTICCLFVGLSLL